MKCVGPTKGIEMKLVKRLLPWVTISVAFLGLGYLYGTNCTGKQHSLPTAEVQPTEYPQLGKIEHVQDDVIQCPPQTQCPACPEVVPPPACPKQAACPPPRIEYRDRPVPYERKIPYGCNVDWRTGEVVARSRSGMNIECVVDKANKRVDKYEYDPRLLRRGNGPDGLLEKAYQDYIEGKL